MYGTINLNVVTHKLQIQVVLTLNAQHNFGYYT